MDPRYLKCTTFEICHPNLHLQNIANLCLAKYTNTELSVARDSSAIAVSQHGASTGHYPGGAAESFRAAVVAVTITAEIEVFRMLLGHGSAMGEKPKFALM